jgi:DNA-binding LacI/PurR family transcriptional regulator
MHTKTVTIKDIAAKLGLHYATVSRALGGHPGINHETRKRVLRVVRELQYQPNSVAYHLRKRKSRIIGMVVPALDHYFFSRMVGVVTSQANLHDYQVILFQSHDLQEQEIKDIQLLMDNRVAGVILSLSQSTRTFDHILTIQRQGIPVVFFDRVSQQISATQISVDNYQGAFEATAHLIRRGHLKIGHLMGPQNLTVFKHRMAGYRDALKMAGLAAKKNWLMECDLSMESGAERMAGVLASKDLPDAIFAANDQIAFGAMRQVFENGLDTPHDVAITGFDDVPAAALISPPLTTMAQPVELMAKMAFDLLIEEIETNKSRLQNVVLVPRLIIRKST